MSSVHGRRARMSNKPRSLKWQYMISYVFVGPSTIPNNIKSNYELHKKTRSNYSNEDSSVQAKSKAFQ